MSFRYCLLLFPRISACVEELLIVLETYSQIRKERKSGGSIRFLGVLSAPSHAALSPRTIGLLMRDSTYDRNSVLEA